MWFLLNVFLSTFAYTWISFVHSFTQNLFQFNDRPYFSFHTFCLVPNSLAPNSDPLNHIVRWIPMQSGYVAIISTFETISCFGLRFSCSSSFFWICFLSFSLLFFWSLATLSMWQLSFSYCLRPCKSAESLHLNHTALTVWTFKDGFTLELPRYHCNFSNFFTNISSVLISSKSKANSGGLSAYLSVMFSKHPQWAWIQKDVEKIHIHTKIIQILVHAFLQIFRCTIMLWISCTTISQRCSIGFRYSDCVGC